MCPLQDSVIPIDFGGGLDSKTDPKKVVPGKYLLVQDGVFTAPSQVRKRNGYTPILPDRINMDASTGNLIAPNMIRTYNDELVAQDSGKFYGYSETVGVWVQKGNYQSVDVVDKCFFEGFPSTGEVDVASSNGLSVYVGSFITVPPQEGNTTFTVYAAAVDQDNNNFIIPPEVIPTTLALSTTGEPRAIALDTSAIGITYVNNQGSANQLVLRLLIHTTLSIVFGPEVALASNVGRYDLTTTTTGFITPGFAVAYIDTSTGNLTVKTYDSTGTLQATNATVTGAASNVHINSNTVDGNLWVYYVDGADNLKYVVYPPTLATIPTPTLINGPGVALFNPSAVTISNTTQEVYYGVGYGATGFSAPATAPFTRQATVTTTGVVTGLQIVLPGAFPASHAFTVLGRNYMILYHSPPTQGTVTGGTFPVVNQNTYFVVDLALDSLSNSELTIVGRLSAQLAFTSFQIPGMALRNAAAIVGTNSVMFGGVITQNNNLNADPDSAAGAFIWTLTFYTNRTYKSEVSGNMLMTNGAIIDAYDGALITEWNFNLYPELLSVIQVTSGIGAFLPAGTYSYIAVYEWLDANGNKHQSETSVPVQVVIPASTTRSVEIAFTMLGPTAKSNVQVVLYRTLANQSIYIQLPAVTSGSPLVNQSAAVAASFTDDTLDTDLIGGLQLYTTGGVLDNGPPQPSLVLTSRLNRLWYVDAENTNTTYYSKAFTLPGQGLSPSQLLLINANPDQGSIAGLSMMDEKLVFFKDKGITWSSGDGADATGQNSTFATPQNLPSDVGITNSPSIILTPKGIIFQTSKGIYLLDRSLGLHYYDSIFTGASVEQYNGQVISDARIMNALSQIRFLTQSGSTLVYDYIFDKWASFSNHLGIAADIWNGNYVYLRAKVASGQTLDASAIFQENDTNYLDNVTAYNLQLQTSWLALGSVQGFERVKIAQTLGDYLGGAGHGIQISYAYDFIQTFTPTSPYSFDATSGPFQFRSFPERQKCDAISLLIQEIVTGVAGEYIDLTNLSFDAGVKKGLHKLAASRSVG
jgi:hypothetical protein